jgi:NADH-quinone oxidoreductase subunit N
MGAAVIDWSSMNWTLALPEIVLACCGMAILLLGVIVRGNFFRMATMLVVGSLVVAGIMVVTGGQGVGFAGMFTVDAYSGLAKLLALVCVGLAVITSLDYNEHEDLQRFEFPVLMLFSALGMMLMASATNLMMLYMGLELMALSTYILAAFARDDLRSSEAGLKYFVLGALASGLLLYGLSLVYGFSGSMDYAQLGKALADPAHASPGLIVGVVFMIAGLSFKISAVPFHMWTPDVYEGAPTPITTFLGSAPKVAGLVLLMRLLATPFGHLLMEWQQLIVLISIASMLLGTLGAIGQRNFKRMMAYSTIGHVGYMLIGLAAGTQDGIRGALIYLVIYVFMYIGTFALITAMRRRGRAVESIADLGGLGRTDPLMAMGFAIFMFSMAGIPPLSGFWGKYFVFAAAVNANMWTLAILGVLISVMGAFYYIRVIKVIYFDEARPAFDPRPASLSFVAAIGGLVTTFFFVFPAPIVAAAEAAAKVLFR